MKTPESMLDLQLKRRLFAAIKALNTSSSEWALIYWKKTIVDLCINHQANKINGDLH